MALALWLEAALAHNQPGRIAKSKVASISAAPERAWIARSGSQDREDEECPPAVMPLLSDAAWWPQTTLK